MQVCVTFALKWGTMNMDTMQEDRMRTVERRRRSDRQMDEQIIEGFEEGQLRRLLTNTIDTIEDNKT